MAQINRIGDTGGFDNAVQQGLSANLCDAIENLTGYENGEGLKISIQWALTEPRPEAPPNFNFTKSDAPALKEAASRLKEHRDSDVVEVRGQVTRLERSVRDLHGNATIRSELDGGRRNVQVDFAPEDYSRIVMAHENRWSISLWGI